MSDAQAPDTGRQSVGTLLRLTREARGFALDDAARVTRIGKNYLEALEEDAFDKLPSPAYAKGFLRAYGVFLGLSPDELVGRYEAGAIPRDSDNDDEDKLSPSSGGSPPTLARNRWAIPLLLLALVIVTSLIVREGDREMPQAVKVSQPAKDILLSPPVQRPVSTASPPRSTPAGVQVEAPTELPVPEHSSPSPVSQGIILRLKVIQDCWLNMTIDGTVSQQYDLRAGDLIEWKGERVFSLDLGNSGGVEAEFNGKGLPPFGEPGKPAHIVLKADEAEE
ncbi:MAG: helix-turn-helix domain-containing protein [Desulfuromonadales bacterium]|nr:MAG: helix-turn-helix domain-containing protein [Desulfuromonadales bacterium]